MSKKFKFRLNRKAVGDLLKSDEMKTVVDEYATAIKNRCGEGYENDSYKGKTRVNAMVYADTPQAKRDNIKNNTILKAVQ